jgi:hypothetical protein
MLIIQQYDIMAAMLLNPLLGLSDYQNVTELPLGSVGNKK